MSHKVRVSSEIGPLRRVIVHRPDEGIARISPKRAEELLFDDIVHLPQMQAEHDLFVEVLGALIGEANVMDTSRLLQEALQVNEASKKRMINRITDYEELPSATRDLLLALPDDKLTNVLISGYFPDDDLILFDPIPNFIFTRDIAVCVNDHLVITKAAKEARFRENFLTRFILSTHPIFEELNRAGRLINLNEVEEFPPSKRGERVSVEGGDVMIIHPDYLLVGCSERTNEHGINSLRKALFKHHAVKNVVQVNIPQERSYMHIDTIFTQINHLHVVAYKPIVMDGLGSNVEVHHASGTVRKYLSIQDFSWRKYIPTWSSFPPATASHLTRSGSNGPTAATWWPSAPESR